MSSTPTESSGLVSAEGGHNNSMRVLPCHRRASVAALAVYAIAPSPADADPDFARTIVVDPSASAPADFTTIANAISHVISTRASSTEPWTVLIYPATYQEQIVLNGDAENIAIVGVDRDAVRIEPPTSQAGLLITGGDEQSRNQLIAHLTIETDGAPAIVIARSTQQQPAVRAIRIDDVIAIASGATHDGLTASGVVDLTVTNSRFESARSALVLQPGFSDPSTRTTLRRVRLTGGRVGLRAVQPVELTVQQCDLTADASKAATSGDVTACLILEDNDAAEDVVIQTSRITATQDEDDKRAIGLHVDTAGDTQILGCDVDARNLVSTSTDPFATEVYGVLCGDGSASAPQVILLDSYIRASATYPRFENVYDIAVIDPAVGTAIAETNGGSFTTWRGAIGAADRPTPYLQWVSGTATREVAEKDDDAVLGATTISSSEQVIDTGITSPDVYRALSVAGSDSDLAGHPVIILGANWAGESIAEIIDLGNGTDIVDGKKPFLTVTSIVLPGVSEAVGATVRVGTTNKLGLHKPIAKDEDVLDNGSRGCGDSDAAFAYAEVDVALVDPEFATVDVTARFADGSFANGDCVVLSVLAAR